MMNKKGFLPRDFVIAGIFLMGIISLMILMVQGIADNYGSADLVDEDFSAKYDKLENVTADVTVMLDTTRSGEGLSFKGVFDVTFGAAFTVIQLVFGLFGLFANIFENIVIDFDVEDAPVLILLILASSILTITIIFSWLSSISRGKI